MAVVFLIIEKAFETTWHLGLLYKFNWWIVGEEQKSLLCRHSKIKYATDTEF
jgi:hypothetical protein